MGEGAKRNKPCWCQSGLKYKDCHHDREQMPAPTFQDNLGKLRKLFGKKYCLHPNAGSQCKGNVINAHTVQLSRNLTKIARRGHVYSPDPGDAELMKTGMVRPRLVGIREASTFTGFCSFHDTKIFEPIEKHNFIGSLQQCFLLSYRALCRELFMKRARVEHLFSVRELDKGANLIKQIWWQDFVSTIERGEKSSLKLLEEYKLIYDRCLLDADFSDVQFYIIYTGTTPEFMCNGNMLPAYDFFGRTLQDLHNLNEKHPPTAYSIVATETGGAVVFSWVGSNQAAKALINSLDSLPDDEVCHAITRFSFEYIENIFMSPQWWEELTDEVRRNLIMRMMSELRPDTQRVSNCLMGDGVRIVSWPITRRATNIALDAQDQFRRTYT
jgi:SEC-C motif